MPIWSRRIVSCAGVSTAGGGDTAAPTASIGPCVFMPPPVLCSPAIRDCRASRDSETRRSEEHTSELQSLMRISYAVFCLKKKNKKPTPQDNSKTDTNHMTN